jgi:hypothetical protein
MCTNCRASETCEIVNKADYSQISQKTDCLTDVFVVFLSHFMQWPGYYLKLGHSGFLTYPVQFIIILHNHPIILCYTV